MPLCGWTNPPDGRYIEEFAPALLVFGKAGAIWQYRVLGVLRRGFRDVARWRFFARSAMSLGETTVSYAYDRTTAPVAVRNEAHLPVAGDANG